MNALKSYKMHQMIDLKSTILCVLFMMLPSAGTFAEWSIKILGFLIYAGYHARKWYLMEQSNKSKD